MPKRIRNLFIFLFIISLLSMAAYYTAAYLPNSKTVPPQQYYAGMDLSKIHIVLDDLNVELETAPVFYGGELYIPTEFIKKYIDKYIFWDTKYLIITTENELIKFTPGESSYLINFETHALEQPVRVINGDAYISRTFTEEFYGIEMKYSDGAIKNLIIDMPGKSKTLARISAEEVSMRYLPDKKSPIQQKVTLGDDIFVFGLENGYAKIRTENGLIGYIPENELVVTETIPPTVKDKPVTPISNKKLNIVWDMVTSVASNSQENKRIIHKGLDVLSPTWFSFDIENKGTIISLASNAYVEWAHQNGYEVWALISDNFKSEVSHAVLSSTETREYVIKQLLELITEYNLDGINIDFEAVKPADAAYFLQFLRELAPLMKQRQAVLSVDLYVPTYTKYYNRTEIARTVDYIIIMGYDETEFYSNESGPAASAPFVERGIADTLTEAPPQKVILGIPYYCRIWMEENVNGEVFVQARDVGMNYAYRIFNEQGVEFEWLDDLKCHYGEFNADEEGKIKTYKVWLEDLKSIEEKLRLADKYGLAGVSGWRRDLETEGVWDLINYYLKE